MLLYKEVMFKTINSWITFYGVIPTTLLLRIHNFFPSIFQKHHCYKIVSQKLVFRQFENVDLTCILLIASRAFQVFDAFSEHLYGSLISDEGFDGLSLSSYDCPLDPFQLPAARPTSRAFLLANAGPEKLLCVQLRKACWGFKF